jgi:hypothetical protein
VLILLDSDPMRPRGHIELSTSAADSMSACPTTDMAADTPIAVPTAGLARSGRRPL